ncbi:hypothetical protein M3231_11550 [Neobacillus mesonae]|nr:hypothetical protein [Neobacillus mesonae]
MPDAEPFLIKDPSYEFKSTTVIIDSCGKICSYNHAWPETMSQYDSREIENWLGLNYFHILASFPGTCTHNTSEIIYRFKEVLNRSITSYVCEVRVLREDSCLWILIEASPYETSLQSDFKGLVITHIDITHHKTLEHRLHNASSHIKTLHGMLPICAVCKRIRDEQDEWNTVESFVERHTHAEFTHDICPECIRKLYPQYSKIFDQS